MRVPQALRELAEAVKTSNDPHPLTVRELLHWYDYSRRGSWIVEIIEKHLTQLGVMTIPKFAGAYIDATIYLAPKTETKENVRETEPAAISDTTPANSDRSTVASGPHDPLHQISRIKAANTPPISVVPNDPLTKAVTLMQINDYSQLPVMNGERDLKGLISWKTIGQRLAARRPCTEVRECMGNAIDVSESASIFDVIREIELYDCVVVRGADKKLMGIVTAADISVQFRTLAEPFLLLGDIENQIRRLIERANFDIEALRAVRDPGDSPREVKNVADLTFGDYRRLMENPEHWDRMGLNSLDRATFVNELDEVRIIRNEVMHFDPDGIDGDQLRLLRRFARFLDGVMQMNG